jgi:small subunit ribosomal protein S19
VTITFFIREIKMARSLWKGPFFDNIYPLCSRAEKKISSRRSIILPRIVGQFVVIANGKKFHTVFIDKEMIGHRFGEFANTRKKGIPKKKGKKKK